MAHVVEQADIVTIRGSVRETPTQRVYARGQQESWRTMARVELTALRRNRKSWQPTTGRMAIVFGIFFCLFRALRLPRALSGLALISLI